MKNVSMLRRAIAVGLVSVLSMGTFAAVPAVAADKTSSPFQFPIVGTTTTGLTFTGTATITRFAVSNGKVVAVGTISGLVDNAQSIVTTFTAPVGLAQATATGLTSAAAASCDILSLSIGPVHLDVLGLVIDIPNPIVVNITAVPGAGNLLGNLLCQVANLLNTGGPVQQIADLLNQILGILNGL